MTARSYDVVTVALTVDAPSKWVDNLLSQHDVPGCSGGRQGVARRISDHGVLAIAVIRLLTTDLGLPVGRAVRLVRLASHDTGIGPLVGDSGPRIEIPPGFAVDLADRLRDALLEAPRRTRGRPPAR